MLLGNGSQVAHPVGSLVNDLRKFSSKEGDMFSTTRGGTISTTLSDSEASASGSFVNFAGRDADAASLASRSTELSASCSNDCPRDAKQRTLTDCGFTRVSWKDIASQETGGARQGEIIEAPKEDAFEESFDEPPEIPQAWHKGDNRPKLVELFSDLAKWAEAIVATEILEQHGLHSLVCFIPNQTIIEASKEDAFEDRAVGLPRTEPSMRCRSTQLGESSFEKGPRASRAVVETDSPLPQVTPKCLWSQFTPVVY